MRSRPSVVKDDVSAAPYACEDAACSPRSSRERDVDVVVGPLPKPVQGLAFRPINHEPADELVAGLRRELGHPKPAEKRCLLRI